MAFARRWRWFVAIAAVAIVLDQLSKVWARHALAPGESVAFIPGVWDWRLSFNPGASFNLFERFGGARVLLSIMAVGAIAAMAWMVARARDDQRRYVIALGLIAGGAAGNLIDRLHAGVVTDFALWHWKDAAYWPMFNVADAALVVGVVILLFSGAPRSSSPA